MGYVAQTATAEKGMEGLVNLFEGAILGIVANIGHDIGQSVLNIQGGMGTSWNDYSLGLVGMQIGIDITKGNISPYELGDVIRERIGENSPGSGINGPRWVPIFNRYFPLRGTRESIK